MAAAVLEAIAPALQERHYEQLAKIMDLCELESPNPRALEDWPHALHLLSHIYNKNWSDARFLWKRIPGAVKQNNPELEAVWRLLQYYWSRQYQGIWQALQAYQWSPQLQPVVEALAIKTREELMELIGFAYSTVAPSKVASICGMTEAEALNVCQAQGWEYDAATGMLMVSPKAAAQAQLDGYSNLQQMAEYMVHLEQ
mmetsp:Transcript_4479/g.9636  ORF Transcript_4479/g.9636 Transcript_4479/m.9636 type:complete len:199 (+) Transcript_4479:138-734(+)